MTYRNVIEGMVIKELRATPLPKYGDSGLIQVIHVDNLVVDTLGWAYYYQHSVRVTYTKPYSRKYFGLVIEWLLNNKPVSRECNINFIPVGYQVDGRHF